MGIYDILVNNVRKKQKIRNRSARVNPYCEECNRSGGIY